MFRCGTSAALVVQPSFGPKRLLLLHAPTMAALRVALLGLDIPSFQSLMVIREGVNFAVRNDRDVEELGLVCGKRETLLIDAAAAAADAGDLRGLADYCPLRQSLPVSMERELCAVVSGFTILLSC